MAQGTDTESTRSKKTCSVHEDEEEVDGNEQLPSELSPLLRKTTTNTSEKLRAWNRSVVIKLLLTSTFVSLSFAVTQVPMIYVFGLMTCTQYYHDHPSEAPPADSQIPQNCHRPTIQSSTAQSVAILGAVTTLFGVLNLFYTNWAIKRFGCKSALLSSVFWPAVRLGVQNVGVAMGGGVGILIIQASQMITVVGGPAGYLLALNSFATEVVEARERTGTLGRLQGCSFFGTALGYFLGGVLSDGLGVAAPFRVTLGLFLLSSLYIAVVLPGAKVELSEEAERETRSISSFFEPLRMFVPQRWRGEGGKVRMEYGIVFLGIGAFTAILATGYIPVLLQMYATDVWDFGTTDNGILVAANSLIRGLYLTFAFPAIISSGRKWLDRRQAGLDKISEEESHIPDIPTNPEEFQPGPIEAGQEPIEPPKPKAHEDESFHFDLLYARYSILTDGVLTALATFTSQGWQTYVIAVVLPLAAGTGSASKGTILQMCSPSQRSDALSAISLVEMVASLATIGLFGFIFSAFAAIGRPSLTFAVNGGVAILAFVVFCFCRFPPEGSTRVQDGEAED